mgnify:FL=1
MFDRKERGDGSMSAGRSPATSPRALRRSSTPNGENSPGSVELSTPLVHLTPSRLSALVHLSDDGWGFRTVDSLELPTPVRSNNAAATATEKPARKRCVVGICAMEKKTSGHPMQQIIKWLTARHDEANDDSLASTSSRRIAAEYEFEVVVFSNHTILSEPVRDWPQVDCLLAWFSTGFPLAKVLFSPLTSVESLLAHPRYAGA